MGIFGIPQKRICADFAPIRLVNTLLSVAKVRISEQKAKLIMDFFGWECFEWAQIWKIVLLIWKIFHKIFTFLDKNTTFAPSKHWFMEKNALLNHEVVMASSDKTTNNFISKMKKEGRLIKIAAKIYTTNLNDTPENIIRRNLFFGSSDKWSDGSFM